MDLIILVLTLAIIGFAVWFITEKIPMHAYVKLAIQVLVLVVVLLYLLRILGGSLPNVL